MAKNNEFPISILTDLKTKIIKRKKQKQKQTQTQQQEEITTQRYNKVTFTYHSPLVRQITNLFKQTVLKIRFRATSTIQQLNTAKHRHKDPSGIYKLKCNTCTHKGKHMDCWEAVYMQALHNKQVLISEQQIGQVNPLFQMATITFTP
jgi:hypothetical protein